MKKDIIKEFFKKASILYLIASILSIIIVLGGLIFYLVYIPGNIEEPEEEDGREALAKKQLEELEKLRMGAEPLTGEEVKDQLEELDDLRESKTSLTEEEIQKQLEELENSRNQ